MNISGKRVLITDGSSGIGLALARALLAKGAKVVITGRRANTLAQAVEELQQSDSSIHGVSAAEARTRMIALNNKNLAAIDGRFLSLKPALEEAVKDHSAL